MNTLPAAFEERTKNQLQQDTKDFLTALGKEPPVSIRFNPGKPCSSPELFPGIVRTPVPWCEDACYLSQRPVFTLDPYFHAGGYYVQEASSMFLHHILKQILPDIPVRVLDLCAAPGGKSTLTASLLPAGSLLVSNEVVRNRASILKENIIKWGQDNIVVTGNDPSAFRSTESAFDIIIVDAPCSGEGMFRKEAAAVSEWSENNLRLCSERQQRILTDIWPSLKPGGYLIYSTCTYNPGENEEILEWMLHTFAAESIRIEHSFNTVIDGDSPAHCYHFYPHKICGEGFFTGVLRKQEGIPFSFRRNKKQNSSPPVILPEEIKSMVTCPENYRPYLSTGMLGVVPAGQEEFISRLETTLRVIYKGCELAEINNRKIKMAPAAALWQGLNMNNCSVYRTDKTTALTFLKKEDIPAPDLPGDWLLIAYRGNGLGWCKHLGNRLNNYYPKEWRIRMQLGNVPE